MQLNVEHISKRYGTKKVLDGTSFVIKSGEITALIGGNGAGKTTTIKCLTKLMEVDEGNIYFNQQNIKSLKNKEYRVAYIPDAPVYFEQLTVLENLQFICAAYEQDEVKIMPLIKRLDLIDYMDLLPDELSKGNKQKIMIAGALLREFDILIADEPFIGLDSLRIKVLKEIFLEEKAKGKIILVSTHSLDLAQTFCDQYVILRKGKVILQADEAGVLQRGNRSDAQRIERIEEAYLEILIQADNQQEED